MNISMTNLSKGVCFECQDYAMEPDETLIRNAAHLMVARLAGSLAHVTCKVWIRPLFLAAVSC